MLAIKQLLFLLVVSITTRCQERFLTAPPEKEAKENMPPVMQDMLLRLQQLQQELADLRLVMGARQDNATLQQIWNKLNKLERQQEDIYKVIGKIQTGVQTLEMRLLQLEEDEDVVTTEKIDWGFNSAVDPSGQNSKRTTTAATTTLISAAECKDDFGSCAEWAARQPSECLRNPGFMLLNCKLSCHVCGGATTAPPPAARTDLPHWEKSSIPCGKTSPDALGPYYKSSYDGKDFVCKDDAKINSDRLVVHGYVFDRCGQPPVPGALVELWQADSGGNYVDHCRGKVTTDHKGYYKFTTVYPGQYWPRPKHLHFRVSLGNDVLVTQMYFKSEEAGRIYTSLAVDTEQLDTYQRAQFNFVLH